MQSVTKLISKPLSYLKKNQFFILFLLFTFGLNLNLSTSKFYYFQDDSEALVIGSLEQIREKKKVFFQPPFLGRCSWTDSATANAASNLSAHAAFERGLACKYEPYLNQVSLNGFISGAIYTFFETSPHDQKILVAVLNSGLLILLAALMAQESFLGAVLFVLISFYTQTWQKFGGNLYWLSWVWLCLIVALFKLKGPARRFTLGFISILRMAIGFEYITCLFLMPVAFYLLEMKKGLLTTKQFLRESLLTVLIQLSGFSLCFAAWIAVVKSQNNQSAMEVIQTTILKRIGSGSNSQMLANIDPIYHQSIEAGYLETLGLYLRMPYLFLILATLMAGVLSLRYAKPIYKTYFYPSCLAFMASMSWLVLAKAHSFIHTHINYFVWELPFTFFACLLIGKSVPVFYSYKSLNAFSRFRNT
ncbi:MAG: hypothetical protein RJB66_1701 [Pseudomonadota bacterium]|jgi:energy-converting hydrogenase Eha subunit C